MGTQTTDDNQNNGASDNTNKVAAVTPDNNIFNDTTFGIYNWVWLVGIAGALDGWWYIVRRRG